MKRKILAAFILAFIAIVLALSITHFSFREMMGTVDELSAPNEKLTKLNKVFEDITMLDQQQRAEVIENPEKPAKYFLDQSGFIHLMIDSLKNFPWDSVQLHRINSMQEILNKRNQYFVSYMKVKAELADNREFSHQLDTLSALLVESQKNTDSSVVTTQKKTITTYFPADSLKIVKNDRGFFKKLFGKKKDIKPETPQLKVKEELNITVDTLAVAKPGIDLIEINRVMRELETDQRSQRRKLERKELELIHSNSLFINQLLSTLHEVENEEMQNMRASNNRASKVFYDGISRMNILMLTFFLGAALLVYLILIDISKSNFYKKQLEKAKDHAEELTKIKQRFLANMSHEIRTPLQSIIGFTEQLRSSDTHNDQAVEAIHSSSEHLLHIVNEVLDYSRISSGSFTLAKDKFKLLMLVREVESAMRIQSDRKKLTFIVDTEKTSDYNLMGDPFRLRQILYNLLSNAIKFTHKGFIRLTVKTLEENGIVNTIFEITDSGIGMSADELKKVFNQFEQANHNITKSYGGTGLGLTIVKSLVDVQQGELEVNSEPGVGSTFRVALNFEKLAEPIAQPLKNNIVQSTQFKGKVIVVDDDVMILKLCSLIFKKNNIQNTTHNDAEKMLSLKADLSVTHIFIDIRMPGMNGVQLCNALKKKYSSRVKFTALTAHVLPEERDNLIRGGFNSVLPKPFYESEFLQALDISAANENIELRTPDFTIVRQMTMGDEALFQSVMQQFLEESTDDLSHLKVSAAAHDKKQVREIVHKLAGRLGQMGVYPLSEKLHNIEVSLVDGKSLEEVKIEIRELVKEITVLLRNVSLHTIAHLN